MTQEADTTNTDLAKAAIENAEAEAKPQGQGAAESQPAQAASTEPTTNAFADEDAELAALEAELAGKPKKEDKTPEAGPPAAVEAVQSKESGAEAAKPAQQPVHDPKDGVIVALRKKNQELTGALLVREGENRVLKTLVDPEKFAGEAGDGGTKAEPTPEEQELQALDAERLRIAEEVDAGRMTMREHNQTLNQIAARERAIMLAETQAMVQQNSQPTNDLGLQEHVTTLIQKFPVLNTLTAAQLAPFEQIAYDQAAAEGKPIQPGPVGTRELRERMGTLAQQTYGKPTAVAATNAGNGGNGANQGQPVTQPTAAQREAKLTQAANHPPNIGATGSGATGGELTDAQIEAGLSLPEDAAIKWLEANPSAMRKLTGRSFR